MDMTGRQWGRAVADYSADFEVEDVVPVSRLPRDASKSDFNDHSARLPRLHKPSKPTTGGFQSSGGAAAANAAAAAVAKQPIADLDPHRLAQRQKQVDYGKNTIGYQRYIQQVPKDKRRRRGEQWLDPVTPDIQQNISKRCFDGQIKVWRRALHKYDIQEGDENEQQVRPMAFAERVRHNGTGALYNEDARIEDATAVSAVPSSPTNSSRSRGSLDGYVEPHFADGGRKRCFQRAFDRPANGNPHPSKLITSPAGPKYSVPQSAPPATAADADPAPSPALRYVNPPALSAGLHFLPRDAATALSAGVPKVPQTAPPAAAAAVAAAGRVTARSTADAPDAARSELGTAAVVGDGRRGEDLFREWDDEEYTGLEALDDDELDQVDL